jgi:hypothetical protein
MKLGLCGVTPKLMINRLSHGKAKYLAFDDVVESM